MRGTKPLKPGQPRLRGADAMHAWVSVWCGEEAGWQGLDPTNSVRAATDHVPLAFGRDDLAKTRGRNSGVGFDGV